MTSEAGQHADGHCDVENGVGGGLGYSIRPGLPVPETVLVVDMGNGALVLHGWRDGPSAYVCSADSMDLRQTLAVAYGSRSASQPHD